MFLSQIEIFLEVRLPVITKTQKRVLNKTLRTRVGNKVICTGYCYFLPNFLSPKIEDKI